jgi:AbrB family looped-hinge helix DNA binding protein
MKATITSKGQITIPLAIRRRFNLNAGDQLEFDENAAVITARRVVNRSEWTNALRDWRKSSAQALRGHPWGAMSSADTMDDLRGGPADSIIPRE